MHPHAPFRLLAREWEEVDLDVRSVELGPGAGKPSPAGFRRIEAASGVDGAACVYVADNPAKDFAGPRALGWKTVRVRRPGGLHVDAPSGDDVDAEIGTLDALDPLLVPG